MKKIIGHGLLGISSGILTPPSCYTGNRIYPTTFSKAFDVLNAGLSLLSRSRDVNTTKVNTWMSAQLLT